MRLFKWKIVFCSKIKIIKSFISMILHLNVKLVNRISNYKLQNYNISQTFTLTEFQIANQNSQTASAKICLLSAFHTMFPFPPKLSEENLSSAYIVGQRGPSCISYQYHYHSTALNAFRTVSLTLLICRSKCRMQINAYRVLQTFCFTTCNTIPPKAT